MRRTEKILPAGEHPTLKNAIFEGRMPRTHTGDPLLEDKPKRSCARCGANFLPTTKRRMLCLRCYGRAGGYDE